MPTEPPAVAGGPEVAERRTPNATRLPAIAQKRSRNTRGCPPPTGAGSVTLVAHAFFRSLFSRARTHPIESYGDVRIVPYGSTTNRLVACGTLNENCVSLPSANT